MTDIEAPCEAHDRGDISDVGWIVSGPNIADGLTKVSLRPVIETFHHTGKLDLAVDQWVIRRQSQHELK